MMQGNAPTTLEEGPRQASAGEQRLTPQSYRTTLHCRRCKSAYHVPNQSERWLYWWCHRSEGGDRCGTINVWRREKADG